jgi:hypothetical protein
MALPVADGNTMEHIRRSLRQRALRTRGRPSEAQSDSSGMSLVSESDDDDSHAESSTRPAPLAGEALAGGLSGSISGTIEAGASPAVPSQALADLISGLGIWQRLASARRRMVEVPGRIAVANAAARASACGALLAGQQGYIAASSDAEPALSASFAYGTSLLTDVDAVAIAEQLRSHQRQAATPTSQLNFTDPSSLRVLRKRTRMMKTMMTRPRLWRARTTSQALDRHPPRCHSPISCLPPTHRRCGGPSTLGGTGSRLHGKHAHAAATLQLPGPPNGHGPVDSARRVQAPPLQASPLQASPLQAFGSVRLGVAGSGSA